MGIRAGYLISGLCFGKKDTGNLLQNNGRNALRKILRTIKRKLFENLSFCVPVLSPLDMYNPTNKRNMYLP